MSVKKIANSLCGKESFLVLGINMTVLKKE